MENIRVMLQYDSCFSIDVEGRSGGLAVMWKDHVRCRVLNYSRNFINLIVEDDVNGEWRLTCYYGYPERSRRRMAWNLLRELRNMSPLPWCVIGDFNDLLSQDDKKGLHSHPNWLCYGFRNAVSDCDLTNIQLEGYPFTWIKSRGTEHVIEERLDRALASTEWISQFPKAKLINLLTSYSDHSPILLQCSPLIRQEHKYAFKFENSWLQEEDIREVVTDGWNNGGTNEIVDRLTHCAGKLQRWGRRKRKRFKEEIMEKEVEMERYRDKRD
ncbi:endonuclease/exonuclease/phosphatase family protein, partial [Trifolium medium]|nr:endonuclease/exonuclease/phosphatase family protein [Trifolium medium]